MSSVAGDRSSSGINSSMFSSRSGSSGNAPNTTENNQDTGNSNVQSKAVLESQGGRAFALSKGGRILTWSKYTNSNKPLRLDDSFGKRKMAVVIPRKVAEYHRSQMKESRRYGDAHISDSLNIRDYTEPRSGFRTQKAEPQYRHFNINKYV